MDEQYKPGDIRRVECLEERIPMKKADLNESPTKVREVREVRKTVRYEQLVECKWHHQWDFWEQEPVPNDAVPIPGVDPDGQPTTVYYMWVEYEEDFSSWIEPIEVFPFMKIALKS